MRFAAVVDEITARRLAMQLHAEDAADELFLTDLDKLLSQRETGKLIIHFDDKEPSVYINTSDDAEEE